MIDDPKIAARSNFSASNSCGRSQLSFDIAII
jgi:hypothetical protein